MYEHVCMNMYVYGHMYICCMVYVCMCMYVYMNMYMCIGSYPCLENTISEKKMIFCFSSSVLLSSIVLLITSSSSCNAMRMPMGVNETTICQNGNICEKPNAAYEWIAQVRFETLIFLCLFTC